MMLLFTLFAPVTVPAYLLFVAGSNLLGGAFYVVIEASLTPLIGRPISLSRMQMILLALPVLVAAPLAAVVHVVLWLLRLVVRMTGWIGWWQVGIERRGWAHVFGGAWVIVALWATVVCMNAAAGLGWIGRDISPVSRQRLIEALHRDMTLGELPDEMQKRRRAIREEVSRYQGAFAPKWRELGAELADDDFRFRWLDSDTLWRRLSGIPWFFSPKEFSEDGLDHSILLLGPLLFVWLLLIRWPGMLAALRYKSLAIVVYSARVLGGGLAIYLLLTWVPRTAHIGFNGYYFDSPFEPSALFRALNPALWFGASLGRWARPEWYFFNAGLWMIFAGLAAGVWWVAWRISPFLGWPRFYVAFMASRLLQRKRIAFFSVGAVTLCVAMMIIVISVMGGFVDNIRERAHGLLGDLVVSGNLQGFPYYEEFIAEIGKLVDEKTGLPVVVQATPLINSYGIMQFPETGLTKAVRIWGIRLEEYVRVNEFGKDLFYQNRFGGTRLNVPMGKPVYGVSDAGRIVLPGDMDARFEAYLSSLPAAEREEAERKYPRDDPFRYLGPGVFAPAASPDSKPDYEGKAYPGVIIGRDVLFRRRPSGEYARDVRYPRGEACFLTVLPLTRTGSVSPEPPPKPLFRYIDDSRTGIHEIDSMNVYVDFQRLQELMSMVPQERADGSGMTSPRCSQIQIKLNDAFAWPREVLLSKKRLIEETWHKVASQVPADPAEMQMLDGVDMQTWEEMQQSYIAAIEKEKFLVLIMFGVISIVAVLLILCIFYMIVQEKTRDVGILKSIGASTEGVVAVFLVYGGAIGLVGCVLGSLLGTNFVEHINDVQDWLARINPSWRVWSPDTYSFDKIPSQWKWAEVLWISALSILASVAGAIIPAIRAGRTWPVQSLRYE
jgi:lipoprotein-releasing system permease protein